VSDRGVNLTDLAREIAAEENVTDAWTAKSFTDRLLVVEVPSDGDLPGAVRDRLHVSGLREANEVYDVDAPDADFAGHLDDCRRYRFVDVRTRGDHHSYVVE
jgi:hypothetical protein